MISLDSAALGLGSETARATSGLLFIAAATNAMDVYSALNSSPWTAESFGGDPEKAQACREYVYHAMGVTAFYCIAGAILANNVWPIIGMVIAEAYMYWLYMRALSRAEAKQSTGWGSGQPATTGGF
jgi:hypothetical protein